MFKVVFFLLLSVFGVGFCSPAMAQFGGNYEGTFVLTKVKLGKGNPCPLYDEIDYAFKVQQFVKIIRVVFGTDFILIGRANNNGFRAKAKRSEGGGTTSYRVTGRNITATTAEVKVNQIVRYEGVKPCKFTYEGIFDRTQ